MLKLNQHHQNRSERDNGCRTCGESGNDVEYDPHHITNRKEIPNGGYVKENGIQLCHTCHIKAEDTYFNRDHHLGFTPAELYLRIDSSYELAYSKSSKLK